MTISLVIRSKETGAAGLYAAAPSPVDLALVVAGGIGEGLQLADRIRTGTNRFRIGGREDFEVIRLVPGLLVAAGQIDGLLYMMGV